MLVESAIVGRGSGSIGGMTWSRNRGGMYIRARATPTNPNSTYQQTVRSAAALLAAMWSNTLTKAQRDGWDLYAENVELPNPLGAPRNVGGLGMYIRSNVPRIQCGVVGVARLDDAPSIFDLGVFTEPVVGVCTASADTISVAYTNTDEWAIADGGALFIYTSRPQNPGRNFFKGPYRLAATVEGVTATPPTSPEVVNAAFVFEAAQRLFVFARASTADGRLSAPFRGTGLGV